jgi:hypothetical protein
VGLVGLLGDQLDDSFSACQEIPRFSGNLMFIVFI